MEAKIKRSSTRGNFTTVQNDYLNDAKLSWKAKGIITYVMSLPPDWQLNLSDLKKRSRDGRDATATGLRELISNGYCRRCKVRNEDGTFDGWDYEVSDIQEFEPNTENPFAANSYTDNSDTENTTLINTHSNNNSLSPNTQNKPGNEFAGDLFPEVEKEDKKRTSIFRNSEVYKLVDLDTGDYSQLETIFDTPEFKGVDIVYYFHAVADWSDTKIGVKRSRNGWLATIRNFIRGDMEKNKLHVKKFQQPGQISGAMDYLNEDF